MERKVAWRIAILLLKSPKRYSDLLRDINGISGKVLSRELKEMEANQLVKRSVSNTQSNAVFYELTEYGETTKSIIAVLAEWGEAQR